MFTTTIAIVGGTCMTTIVNWENKLVWCVTNVGLSNYSGCCSTTSNNGFFIVLTLSDAALLSSCEIDFSLILISNNFFCGDLTGVKNPCIGFKDCAPILVGFCSSMKVSGQD
jgi:hypothetical protein